MKDPLFTDPAAFDFSLQANSPAKNVGQANHAVTVDYYGTTRDNQPDLGAVEYTEALGVDESDLLQSNNSWSVNQHKNQPSSNGEISVFPNPAVNDLQIIIAKPNASLPRIFNVRGVELTNQLSISQQSESRLAVDVTQLRMGTYFLLWENGENTRFTVIR